MKKQFIILFLLTTTFYSFSQNKVDKILINDNLFKSDYPEGIYKTKEDFINKTPSDTFKIMPKKLPGKKEMVDTLHQNSYFYDVAKDKKLNDVFAVCYNKYIFFRVEAILKNRNKTDRAQTNNNPNGFVGVLYGGKNYLYTEANLANAWAQGFAYGAGGAIGGIAAQGMINGKGIVWDFKNLEFNIFKNCKDFNEFIKEKYPNGEQECKDQQPDMLKVRKDIQNII